MEGLLQKVYIAARRAPELIQLLNLGHVFPTASISAIVEASVTYTSHTIGIRVNVTYN